MRRVLSVAAWVLLGYGALCAYVYFVQDRMLFYPVNNHPAAVSQLRSWAFEVPGEFPVSGWLIPTANPNAAPLVFYFGGNAEDVSATALELRRQLSANLVVTNYRGYGGGRGAPSEAAIVKDACRVYDEVVDTAAHNGRIIAIGRSLGSGVAVQLAAARRIDALALVTPFDSIRNVASGANNSNFVTH